jgi:HEAT repeat protein
MHVVAVLCTLTLCDPASCDPAQSGGGGAEVDRFVKLLQDKEPEVRKRAAIELGKLGAKSEKALAALKAHLDDPDSGVRLAIAKAMNQIEQDLPAPVVKGAIVYWKRFEDSNGSTKCVGWYKIESGSMILQDFSILSHKLDLKPSIVDFKMTDKEIVFVEKIPEEDFGNGNVALGISYPHRLSVTKNGRVYEGRVGDGWSPGGSSKGWTVRLEPVAADQLKAEMQDLLKVFEREIDRTKSAIDDHKKQLEYWSGQEGAVAQGNAYSNRLSLANEQKWLGKLNDRSKSTKEKMPRD